MNYNYLVKKQKPALSSLEFKKKLAQIIPVALLGNTLIISLHYYLVTQGSIWGFYLFVPFILLNIYTSSIYGSLIERRFRFLSSKKRTIFTILLSQLFPILGLFILISLIRAKDNKSDLSFKNILKLNIPLAIISGLLIATALHNIHKHRQSKNIIYNSMVYYQTIPSVQYISNLGFEALKVFEIKNEIDKKCPSRKDTKELIKCRLDAFKSYKLETKENSPTGNIILMAMVSSFVLKDYSKIEDMTLKWLVTKVVIKYLNKALLQAANGSDSISQSLPYGVYLFSGTLEIPLLKSIETLVVSKFFKSAQEKVINLISKIEANDQYDGSIDQEIMRFKMIINSPSSSYYLKVTNIIP